MEDGVREEYIDEWKTEEISEAAELAGEMGLIRGLSTIVGRSETNTRIEPRLIPYRSQVDSDLESI